jgi:hypothetical protein
MFSNAKLSSILLNAMITPKISGREASYRLLRASLHVRRSELRSRLEYWSFELLESCALESKERIFRSLIVISELISFGEQINEIEPISFKEIMTALEVIEEKITIIGDLNKNFKDFPIRQNTAKEELNNTEIRQKEEIIENNSAKYGNTTILKEESSKNTEVEEAKGFTHLLNPESFTSKNPHSFYSETPVIASTENQKAQGEEDLDVNSPRTIMRQSAILRRVRESGGLGCRLKELIEEFPQVSERTLRYDLERLINQGHVIRVGQGPVSTYLSKQ